MIAASVFLAEVTDDLDAQRDAVQRYIEQAGLRVLPETLTRTSSLPTGAGQRPDPEHLLLVPRGVLGKKPQTSHKATCACNANAPGPLGLPIVQWRSPELDCTTIQTQTSGVAGG